MTFDATILNIAFDLPTCRANAMSAARWMRDTATVYQDHGGRYHFRLSRDPRSCRDKVIWSSADKVAA